MFISFIRALILYFVIIIALRVLGKRQVGQLEPSELVVTVLISELAAIPMQDIGIPLVSGVIPIITIISVELIISVICMNSVKFRKVLCGKPVVVIENGTILQDEMKKLRFTLDELTENLRLNQVTDISTIQFAILETNGHLSVLKKASDTPPAAKDLEVKPPKLELPIMVINDGRLLRSNMEFLGLDDHWLQTQLKLNGTRSVKDVFLLTAEKGGKIYFVKKEHKNEKR